MEKSISSEDSKQNMLKELENEHSSARDPSEIDLEMKNEIDEVPIDNDLSIRYESLIESHHGVIFVNTGAGFF